MSSCGSWPQLHSEWLQGCFLLLRSLSINHSLKIKLSFKEMLINLQCFSAYKKVKGETEKSGKKNYSYIISLLTET